jgi:hypothetical protein
MSMLKPDLQAFVAQPQGISALADTMARRRPGAAAEPAPATPVEQLIRTMQTVKAARFAAAERLERKQLVSVVALSIVSLYFVGLSVWQAVYATTISDPANRLVTLVSVMSSVATMVLALIEAMNDYRMKAHFMHTCALQVNDLLQELRLTPAPDAAAVQDIRRRYNDTIRNCPFNHARIDYLMSRPPAQFAKRLTLWLRYAAGVYGLYAVCLAGPPLLLLLFY